MFSTWKILQVQSTTQKHYVIVSSQRETFKKPNKKLEKSAIEVKRHKNLKSHEEKNGTMINNHNQSN